MNNAVISLEAHRLRVLLADAGINIRPGDTFDTLEDVLSALAVTTAAIPYGCSARWASPTQWQAEVLGTALYRSDSRTLALYGGVRNRAVLEWGIAVAMLRDIGVPPSSPVFRRPDLIAKFLAALQLNTLRLPPDALPTIEGPDVGLCRRLAAASGVEVIRANPDVEGIFDPEDRQTAMVAWDGLSGLSPVVLAILPARPSTKDYAEIREVLGFDVRELPATVRPFGNAEVARDTLRAWRAGTRVVRLTRGWVL